MEKAKTQDFYRLNLPRSSNVKSVVWNKVTNIAEVTFNNNAVYHFRDVTPKEVGNWEKATSSGEYFAQYIKNKSYTKVG